MADKLMRQRAEELKAREFREHGEWPTTIPKDYHPAWESRWEDRFAAAFADQIRLEDAKAVCHMCATGISYGRRMESLPVLNGTEWRHEPKRGTGGGSVFCDAWMIHELRRKEGEGNG